MAASVVTVTLRVMAPWSRVTGTGRRRKPRPFRAALAALMLASALSLIVQSFWTAPRVIAYALIGAGLVAGFLGSLYD